MGSLFQDLNLCTRQGAMDLSGGEPTIETILASMNLPAPVFHPGVISVRPLTRRPRRRRLAPGMRRPAAPDDETKEQDDLDQDTSFGETSPPSRFETWEERCQRAPEPGTLRLLTPPPENAPIYITNLWGADRTLTQWHGLVTIPQTAFETAIYGEDHQTQLRNIFEANQRRRWLARWVLQRWRGRMWAKRPACGVDLIDLAPISDADAIVMTDTTNRTVYRLHRRDVFQSLLSNICMSDEMLPCPRPPTNPYTNAPLTLAQTIAICQQLVADYARRGRCPPVLFSAFWAARFDLTRFQQENASMLAQHAVTSYFKDITDDNFHTVFDTLTSMLVEAGCDFMPTAIRRWLRSSPTTPLHREWLAMIRDYTMYINLHVQIRTEWHNRSYIMADVRHLYARTRLPDPTSQRVRALRDVVNNVAAAPPPALLMPPAQMGLLGLPLLSLGTAPVTLDVSGGMGYDLALQLIQQALFRM